MTSIKIIPKPLFDTLENISHPPHCVNEFLKAQQFNEAEQEYHITREFLLSYSGSLDTFNSYRREVERLLQWSWLIVEKPIKLLSRNDIRDYIEFAKQPPPSWITTKNVARFIDKEGTRIHNPAWRPFVAKIPKAQTKEGKKPDKHDYQLTPKTLQAIFAGLSTYFTFLQQENYIEINPVQLVRQKSRFLQKEQQHKITRMLSHLQWQCVIDTIENLAQQDSYFERHLFLMSAFYLLGLRISELSDTPGRIPKMGDFAPDKHDRWWFTTVGKGNKVRDIAVPDAMLDSLKRYRTYRGLTPLPSRSEKSPLLHKERGRGGLGTRQVRNLVQECFDHAILHLKKLAKEDEAADLAAATVHWLRHTAISMDVEHRPREHVRDDAGHENDTITSRYIDSDRIARHESAKHKMLKPHERKNNEKLRND